MKFTILNAMVLAVAVVSMTMVAEAQESSRSSKSAQSSSAALYKTISGRTQSNKTAQTGPLVAG